MPANKVAFAFEIFFVNKDESKFFISFKFINTLEGSVKATNNIFGSISRIKKFCEMEKMKIIACVNFY